MARKPRKIYPSLVYHVYNRGNLKQPLFDGDGGRDEFLDLMRRAQERVPVRIVAYCLMGNHWHLVLWPPARDAISRFVHWLCTVHSVRYRARTGTTGLGHLYQDRFKSRAVTTELDYLTLVRYVEANALVAGWVERAEHWRWSSLHERANNGRALVESGPVALPLGWLEYVNILRSAEGTDPESGADPTQSAAGSAIRIVELSQAPRPNDGSPTLRAQY